MNKITIYTDGGCLGNPGPGGYGVVLLCGEHRKELSGGFKHTTNNRMELLACIKALESLKQPSEVILFSDSKYVVDAVSKGWAKKWQKNSWMRNKKDRAINPDLWHQLLALLTPHNVAFQWVKGHAGVEENEVCDQLAGQAAQDKELAEDFGYLNPHAAHPHTTLPLL